MLTGVCCDIYYINISFVLVVLNCGVRRLQWAERLCRWDHHIVSWKIINYKLYYIREPGWLIDCRSWITGCMTEEVGFMISDRGGTEGIFLFVRYLRTGSGNHRTFYPVRSRGSVPRCKASSVANNSSSSTIRLYGDMHNLWLVTWGKWGLGFSGILRISQKSKGLVWSYYPTVPYAFMVCVCVHVCVSLLYINYVIVSHFHLKALL